MKSVLSCENEVFEFQIGNSTNSWFAKDEVKKVIHPDGSLLVICEVECLASEETFSMQSAPNTGLLYPNLQLAEHMKKMWKSRLFADCSLEVLSFLYRFKSRLEVMKENGKRKTIIFSKLHEKYKGYTGFLTPKKWCKNCIKYAFSRNMSNL